MSDAVFQVARIQPGGADRAYGLVALLYPSVSADDWAAFVRHHSRDGATPAGVFALQDVRGLAHALFCFAIARSIGGELTLEISEIAMLRLPGTGLVETLLSFADQLAGQLDLPRIAISLERSAAWPQDHDALQRRGFQVDRVMLLGRTGLAPAA